MARKTERRHRQGDESRQAILEATLHCCRSGLRRHDGRPGPEGDRPARQLDLLALREQGRAPRRHSRVLVPIVAGHGSDMDPRGEPAAFSERIEKRFQRAAQALTTSPQFWSLGLLLTLQHRVKEPAARRLYGEVRRETEGRSATGGSPCSPPRPSRPTPASHPAGPLPHDAHGRLVPPGAHVRWQGRQAAGLAHVGRGPQPTPRDDRGGAVTPAGRAATEPVTAERGQGDRQVDPRSRRERSRDRIMAAAAELAKERGVSGATIAHACASARGFR